MNPSIHKSSPAAEARVVRCPAPWNVKDALRERFRRMRMAVQARAGEPRCLGVCSLSEGEGVSWITAKLACAFAETGEATFVVDAHRTRPAQCQLFDVESVQGGAVAGAAGLPLVVRPTSWSQLVISTPSAASPSASASGDGTHPAQLSPEALTLLRPLARYVLVDCESLRESSQVLQLGPALDGLLFVVEAERERREAIASAIESLERSRIPILGLILNKRRTYIPTFLYRRL
jgi:Mrp family chromosome partitioning ATPase